MLEGVGGQDLAEGGPGRGQRQRVAGQRATDPAHVRILDRDRAADAGRDLGAEAVGGRRDAAADRLADDDDVGLEAPRTGRPAGTGADGVGLVDDQERARPAGDVADGVEVARLGQDDADVGQGGLEQDGRDVAVGQRRARARRRR